MKVEGGCLCGGVRFEVEGEPVSSIICHCVSCRKASAAPSVAWVEFERSKFRLTRGSPARFASSPGVARAFCVDCGTPLTYENLAAPATLDVTTVSLDDPAAFPPSREVWLEHRLAWEARNGALDACPRGSSDGDCQAAGA